MTIDPYLKRQARWARDHRKKMTLGCDFRFSWGGAAAPDASEGLVPHLPVAPSPTHIPRSRNNDLAHRSGPAR